MNGIPEHFGYDTEPIENDDLGFVSNDYVSAVERIRKSANKKVLSKAEEVELFKAFENEDESARDELIESNLRLVIAVASKYQGLGVPLEDLIQEGTIGLMKAIKKFDYKRGFKFSTYAIWWIKSHITRCLDNYGRMVRLPDYLCQAANNISATYSELRQKMMREPTREEIAEALDITVEQLDQIAVSRADVKSMDTPLSSEEDATTIGDLIEDESSMSDVTEDLTIKDLVENLFSHADSIGILSDNEKLAVQMRFGIGYDDEMNYGQIGYAIDRSREGARLAVARGLQKLHRVYYELNGSYFQ